MPYAGSSRLKPFVAVFTLTALASCSGGGDDASGAPDAGFPTNAANLTSANAATYANAVALAARMAATMHIGPTLNNTTTPGTYQDPGCGGAGGGPATLSVNPTTGAVTGTLTYSAFDRCFGMRLAGTASVAGNLSGSQVQNANLAFGNLTFTAGTQTFPMSGTATLQWITVGSPTIYGLTLNATVSGASSFRLDSFRIDSTVEAGQERLAITGRLTMVDGFVDLAPGTVSVELPAPGTGLQNGSVRMTGATTIATVFYNAPPAAPSITIAPR